MMNNWQFAILPGISNLMTVKSESDILVLFKIFLSNKLDSAGIKFGR